MKIACWQIVRCVKHVSYDLDVWKTFDNAFVFGISTSRSVIRVDRPDFVASVAEVIGHLTSAATYFKNRGSTRNVLQNSIGNPRSLIVLEVSRWRRQSRV